MGVFQDYKYVVSGFVFILQFGGFSEYLNGLIQNAMFLLYRRFFSRQEHSFQGYCSSSPCAEIVNMSVIAYSILRKSTYNRNIYLIHYS